MLLAQQVVVFDPSPPPPHMANRTSGTTAFGGADHAWSALLALTQASRDLMALAIGGQSRDSAMQQAQAFANRDSAAALLLAMKSPGYAQQTMQTDELHCWYADAQGAADVAAHAVTALQQLTATASAAPVAGAPAHVYIGDIASSPCTPRGRSSIAERDGAVTSFTPIKHLPPVGQEGLDAHASGALALNAHCCDSARPPGHSPRPPEMHLCATYALAQLY